MSRSLTIFVLASFLSLLSACSSAQKSRDSKGTHTVTVENQSPYIVTGTVSIDEAYRENDCEPPHAEEAFSVGPSDTVTIEVSHQCRHSADNRRETRFCVHLPQEKLACGTVNASTSIVCKNESCG